MTPVPHIFPQWEWTVEIIFTLIMSLGCLAIGLYDVMTQKIRNKHLLYLLIPVTLHCFMPAPFGAGSDPYLWLKAFIEPIFLFSLFFIAHITLKIYGAGDVKYGYVIGLWCFPFGITSFIMSTAILSVIFMTPALIATRFARSEHFDMITQRYPALITIKKDKVFAPFGMIMSLGVIYSTVKWLLTLAQHAPFHLP